MYMWLTLVHCIHSHTDEERIGAKRKKKLQHFSNFFGDGGAGFGAGGGMGGLGRGFFGGGKTVTISRECFSVQYCRSCVQMYTVCTACTVYHQYKLMSMHRNTETLRL